ncbi:MAG TPA: hypothetical protein VGB24_22800 [Longimicrobium sp.]|jgi:hypothetical protein|uniref:hypothetical protein n=1 Tax=Longimicrobium sp. TaxID=2029185 RepID=UPI002EDA1612
MSETDGGGTGQTNSDYVQVNPPSPSRVEVSVDGYTSAFYPGFVRNVTVQREGTAVDLYTQAGPFVLPAGAVLPWDSSEFEFRGGPNARDFSLVINDPLHEIASIEIRLKPKGTQVGIGPVATPEGEDETVTVSEATVLCPPLCRP